MRSSGHRRRSGSAVSRTAWQRASSTVCSVAALALALAGCGGDAPRETAPQLPPDVGAALADASGEVAAALEAGDDARARAEVEELLAAVEAAIGDGSVPEELVPEVRAGAERLAALVPEPPPPAPPPAPVDDEDDDEEKDDEDDEDEDEKDKEKSNKGKGKGKDR